MPPGAGAVWRCWMEGYRAWMAFSSWAAPMAGRPVRSCTVTSAGVTSAKVMPSTGSPASSSQVSRRPGNEAVEDRVMRDRAGSGASAISTVTSLGTWNRMCLASSKSRSAGRVSSSSTTTLTDAVSPPRSRVKGPTLCGKSDSFLKARWKISRVTPIEVSTQ